MGLFNKKTKEQMVDRIHFTEMENNDARCCELIEILRNGSPLVINFEQICDDPQATNRLLAFIAGAAYALDGRSVKIKKYVYLFAKDEHFEDGSLTDFVNKYAKNS